MEKQNFKVSEIQVSYKPIFKVTDRPKVNSSALAYEILNQCWDEDKMAFVEEFKVILLNGPKRILGVLSAASGGISEVHVDPRVIFSVALKCCASGIILAHNHPSGELFASEADIRLTTMLKAGAKLLGLEVLDHLILSVDGYYSFADEGML